MVMAQVSVVGLGAMGSTLAGALAERGYDVTVWNRSELPAARAEMLEHAGDEWYERRGHDVRPWWACT
jgi:3-hydroxyisobutyrate dehydrogenase-like beta-hydroxyacid dehydrogenase